MTGSPAITGIPTLSAATREERPSFYVDEPGIPEGMTCADWRRLRRPLRRRVWSSASVVAAQAPAQGTAVVRRVRAIETRRT